MDGNDEGGDHPTKEMKIKQSEEIKVEIAPRIFGISGREWISRGKMLKRKEVESASWKRKNPAWLCGMTSCVTQSTTLCSHEAEFFSTIC